MIVMPSANRHPRESGDPDGLSTWHRLSVDSRFRGNDGGRLRDMKWNAV